MIGTEQVASPLAGDGYPSGLAPDATRGRFHGRHQDTKACVLVLALALAVLISGCRASTGPALQKNDLGEKPAPEFTLTDQNGETVRMSGLSGRAVALTFLYTSCPDVCPVITSTFAQTHDQLGDAQEKARFMVVTVDPERDTVERVRQYLEAQGYQGKMLFLTGDRATLERVWLDYHVGVIKGPAGEGEFYTVAHQNVVYLIDDRGRQRTLIRGWDFTPEQLLRELRPLLNEIE